MTPNLQKLTPKTKLTLAIILGFLIIVFLTIYVQNSNQELDITKYKEAIKKVESEQPIRIIENAGEEEISNSPYIKHIRIALDGYLNGSNTGVENGTLNSEGNSNCGLNNFNREYYKSKFIIYTAKDNKYGGVEADIVFVDKPDTIFWVWIYKLDGGNGDYILRGFCNNGPNKEKETEFKEYIKEVIKNTKYLL